MNKQELQQKINEAKANIELWKKELEKPENKRWQPENGETYLYLETDGDICRKQWNGSKFDAWLLILGNVFKFGEDGECLKEVRKERDRRLAEVELLDMCDGVQSKPYKIKKMWYMQYDLMGDFPKIVWGDATLINPYIFATEESAQKAIDTLGIEKLKLIFRVA